MSIIVSDFAINPGPLGEIMLWAGQQRVHVATLGNSNYNFNTGNAGGLGQALHIKCAEAGFPIYSTPAMTLGGADPTTGAPTTGGVLTQDYPEFFKLALGATTGNYFDPAPNSGTGLVRDPLNPSNTDWTAFGSLHRWGATHSAGTVYSTLLSMLCLLNTTSSTPLVFANNGIQSVALTSANPNLLQWTEKFRGEAWMSNTTVGGGTARPSIVVNNVLTAQTPAITVANGTPTWRSVQRYVTGDVPAGARAGAVRFGVTTPNGTPLTGNHALSYVYVTWPDRIWGFSFGSPWSVGGGSPLDVAFSHYGAARATSDEAIHHYLQSTCQMQADLNQDPAFLLTLEDLFNMRTETHPTAWSTVAVANSVEAYVSHVSYVISRWQTVWNNLRLVGSDGTTVVTTKPNRLKFALALDHPYSVPDDPQCVAFREEGGRILAALFPDQVTVLRMDRIINAAELHAVNSNQGFAANTTRTVNSISTGATPTVGVTASHGLVAGRFINFSTTNSTPPIDGARRILSVPTATSVVIDGPAVTVAGTSGTMTIRDPFHLTKQGYEFAAEKMWAAMKTCTAFVGAGTRRFSRR